MNCLTCNGAGETWDGHSRESNTGQPITHECRDCFGTGEDPE